MLMEIGIIVQTVRNNRKELNGDIMLDYMVSLLVLLCIFAFIAFMVWMVEWTTHIHMNKFRNKPYNWCTFKMFTKEFDKYKDNPELEKGAFNGESIFLYEGYRPIVYLHASIIEFEGKCMILYPISYLRYGIWKYRFNKSANRQKNLWK